VGFDGASRLLGSDADRAGRVRVLVLTGYGLNCEAETAAGFRALGAEVQLAHVADVIAREGEDLDRCHMLAFIGGFSFGDHVASGRVYANRLRYRLGDALARFVDRGGLAIGMCNGFQTMVKLGILPALGRGPGDEIAAQQVSLISNDRRGYRDAWVTMVGDAESPCVFTRGVERIECPSRHAEGRLVFGSLASAERLAQSHLVPLRYADATGAPTEAWPHNPNGSPGGAAGLCDESGRIFGLMPHPEAFLYPENHPRWRTGGAPEHGAGMQILANGVRAALEST
jgi:phosphoribosylformylglycinamidine synthase